MYQAMFTAITCSVYLRQGILTIWLIKVAVDCVSTLKEMYFNFIHTEKLRPAIAFTYHCNYVRCREYYLSFYSVCEKQN
jgi:hypothetical protein